MKKKEQVESQVNKSPGSTKTFGGSYKKSVINSTII